MSHCHLLNDKDELDRQIINLVAIGELKIGCVGVRSPKNENL
jgi:hypothetical protein